MQKTRVQKQNMNHLSSLFMSLDFLRANFAYIMDLERYDYTLISKLEEKYHAMIRQPRCRNGG
ncbi:MAG: hypothetical protein IJ716_13035 [Lachnospiraceae bacterium]|nr:hypothetical protein [Lachnospiraceae bacterium]MBR1702850.1 hypothetical protein [Lachnospiraceae bacterium]